MNALTSADAFNARDLTARQVAERFLAPPQFELLLSDSHCVLEGPRGSGKTTLLKMLTPEAFSIWSSRDTEKRISFIGVLVPADVRWAQQLSERLSTNMEMGAREAITQAVFSVGIGLALIDAIQSCSKLDCAERLPTLCFSISRQMESDIARTLASLWRLQIGVPSFAGLRLALRQRQHDLGTLTLQLQTGQTLANALPEHPYLGSSWLTNTVTALESLNDLLERPAQRWALLLDELEIIPQDLRATIVEALRSTSATMLLKISLSPTGANLIASGAPNAPSAGNDYRSIRLWYQKREDARTFSARLLGKALAMFAGVEQPVDVATLLGSSEAIGDADDDEDGRDDKPDAAPNSRLAPSIVRAFERLYHKDSSFKKVLDSKGLRIDSLQTKDSDSHGPFVRKIAPLVVFRDREIEGYDEEAGKTRRKGAPKSASPYCGFPSLVDITEGNPRWIITLAEALHAKAKVKGLDVSSPGAQAQGVESFVSQFVSLLSVYPIRRPSIGQWTPFKFMEILCNHVRQGLYYREFLTDPALSFKIDNRAWAQHEDYIRVCIDLGALVIVHSNAVASLATSGPFGSLVGTRVRVSYRLAPHFRLPLKHTKETVMSGPLRADKLLDEVSVIRSADVVAAIVERPENLQGRLL